MLIALLCCGVLVTGVWVLCATKDWWLICVRCCVGTLWWQFVSRAMVLLEYYCYRSLSVIRVSCRRHISAFVPLSPFQVSCGKQTLISDGLGAHGVAIVYKVDLFFGELWNTVELVVLARWRGFLKHGAPLCAQHGF